MTPWDIFLDSSAKAPEASDEIPKGEDNLSHDAPKYESTAGEPQSLSGTKSSPHLSKAPSPQNACPSTGFPGPRPMENPQSPEWAESPKTTPPNNSSHGIGSASEDPIGGISTQPQPKSLPRRTPPVPEILANDPDFIQAGFHIGRFTTVVVDTEVDHLNTVALRTELESTSTRINMSSPCIIVHYRLCSILTSLFCSKIN
jgi:hypothetical protein